MARVLVVDDEPAVLTVLQRALEDDGHTVLTAPTGGQAVDLAVSASPDLVILDLGLPDMEGIEVTRILRRWLQSPILILSGAQEEARRVLALDAGADDFLAKPFGVDELKARMRALQRRTSASSDPVVQFGDVRVDLAAGSVSVDGTEIRLTRIEWLLLEALVTKPGKLLTYRMLANEVWGDGFGDELRQTLRGHVRSLRAKIGDSANEPRYIRTESGAGYRWICEAPAERLGGPTPPGTAGDRTTIHDLNNALTVVLFSYEAALLAAGDVSDGEQRDILVDRLRRGQAAARRAHDLTLTLGDRPLAAG